MLGILLATGTLDITQYTFDINVLGGAIEITLTRQDTSSNDNEDSQFQRIIGYVSLFGNTLCMVRIT